jgi:hypothetical protein
VIQKALDSMAAKNDEKSNPEISERMADPDPTHTPTFVVATKMLAVTGSATLFRSYTCEKGNADKCFIWEAARATTAAPSFFAPITINDPKPPAPYVDGGLKHNNPSEVALEEAKMLWPNAKKFCVISIGTGKQRIAKLPKSGSESVLSSIPGLNLLLGGAKGLRALTKIAAVGVELSTASGEAHERMYERANAKNAEFPYYRFDVDGVDDVGLQEWKKMQELGQITQGYMERAETRKLLGTCVRDLRASQPNQRM